MQEIIVFIRPNQYYQTKEALVKAGYFSMNSKIVVGRGKKSVTVEANENQLAQEFAHKELLAKKMLNLIVAESQVPEVIQLILRINQSGNHGDGKIFVCPVDEAIRIRTGETGQAAIMDF